MITDIAMGIASDIDMGIAVVIVVVNGMGNCIGNGIGNCMSNVMGMDEGISAVDVVGNCEDICAGNCAGITQTFFIIIFKKIYFIREFFVNNNCGDICNNNN